VSRSRVGLGLGRLHLGGLHLALQGFASLAFTDQFGLHGLQLGGQSLDVGGRARDLGLDVMLVLGGGAGRAG